MSIKERKTEAATAEQLRYEERLAALQEHQRQYRWNQQSTLLEELTEHQRAIEKLTKEWQELRAYHRKPHRVKVPMIEPEEWTQQMENVPGQSSYRVKVEAGMTSVPTHLLKETRLWICQLMQHCPLHPELRQVLRELTQCVNDAEEPKGR